MVAISIQENQPKSRVRDELVEYFQQDADQFTDWFWGIASKMKPAAVPTVVSPSKDESKG